MLLHEVKWEMKDHEWSKQSKDQDHWSRTKGQKEEEEGKQNLLPLLPKNKIFFTLFNK